MSGRVGCGVANVDCHRFTGRADAVEELLRRPAAASSPGGRFGEVPLHRRGAIVGRVEVERIRILVTGEVGPVEHRAERLVRDDVGAGFVAESHGAAEVVGVRVGDDDRVDVVDGEAGAPETVDEMVPRLGAGEAGIDDGDAPLVLQHVAVHVAEPRHVDGQLGPHDSGGDLADLGRRLLLLLLRLARRVGLAEAGCVGVVVVIVLHGRAGLRGVATRSGGRPNMLPHPARSCRTRRLR